MADTGKTRRTVQRALRDLEDAGWISIAKMGGINGDGRNATIYQLHLPEKRTGGSRGAITDIPGAPSTNTQGRHGDRPTDSLPSHSPTQNNALSELSVALPIDVIKAIQDSASGDHDRHPSDYLLHLLTFHHGEDLADFAECYWTIPKSAARRYVAVARYKTLLNMAAAEGIELLRQGE